MYANKLRKHIHLKISCFPQSPGSSSGLAQRPLFSSGQTEADLTAKISALCPPPEGWVHISAPAGPYFSSRNPSLTLPFQKLRPRSPHQKLKTPLPHLEANFLPHALLARSTHPLTEAEPQFWLQRSPDATETTSLLLSSGGLFISKLGPQSSFEVRSTLLLLEAESRLWLHRQSQLSPERWHPCFLSEDENSLAWVPVPLQMLSPHFRSRV